MKTQIAAVLCLLAAACGSDNQPAQDPSSASAAATPYDPSLAGAPSNQNRGTYAQNQNSGASTNAMAGTDLATAPLDPSRTAKSNAAPPTTMVPPAPQTTPPSSGSMAPYTQPGATGANTTRNPGSADQTPGATNTKTNGRDTGPTVTPGNQGNSAAETRITAAIRRGVMADKTLSFTAKNVKIITMGTKVTLRGPVKTDAERAAIEAIAGQAPGVTDVDNQLEVSSK